MTRIVQESSVRRPDQETTTASMATNRGGRKLTQLAVAALAKTGGDFEKTIRIVERAVWADQSMAKEIIRDAVRFAAYEAGRYSLNDLRRRLTGKRQSRQIKVDLLAFPLYSGLTLAEATRQDLETTIHNYLTTARSSLEYAEWLRRVAARLRGKQTVGEVLSAKQLHAMLVEAQATIRKTFQWPE